MSAALTQDRAHTMVRQMALPMLPERRVKGALSAISRESGLTYSKVRKLYYRLTENILHHEFMQLLDAFKAHTAAQENRLMKDLEEIRRIREEREAMERQIDLNI